MDRRPARDLGAEAGEGGHASVTMLLTVSVLMVVFVTMVNVLLFLYARGVVRAAVDEGARAGSYANASVGECEARADAALADLLGGSLGADIAVRCAVAGDEIVATADAVLHSPIPGVGSWSFSLQGRARNEAPLP